MSAIGLDILNIGGSKWNQQFSELDSTQVGFEPSHFMLPSVENVTQNPLFMFRISFNIFFIKAC
jgi:hypothetical protein